MLKIGENGQRMLAWVGSGGLRGSDWGRCPGHQRRGESKNNANLRNKKHVIDFK